MINAARQQAHRAAEDFRAIVRQSSDILSPLGEPLVTLDFCAHRWVGGHREEAYSDWLQWILAQCDAGEVISVFGSNDAELVSACKGHLVTTVREQPVRQGHEGSSGRLDLAIRFGDSVSLAVEVKLGGAEGADTEKGAGYRRSIEDEIENRSLKNYVILVVDAEDEDYSGFRPRLWEDVCIELRLIGARSCKQALYLKAAMILAFVSVVEQNLLNFQPTTPKTQYDVISALSLCRATQHMERFIEASKHGE